MTPRIAVLGAGAIGRRHAEALAACPTARLAAIADPSEGSRALAARLGVAWRPDLAALLADRPDGVVVATPTALHAAQAGACVEAGVPVLVEKPIAADPAEARALVEAAERAGVPLLVGHHRRHGGAARAAKAAIEAGRIGRIAMVQATTWLTKPAAYFEPEWRRRPGAGPVLTNLVHDLDMLRHLVGEIVEVHALTSRAARGHEVEDAAAAALRFEGGALGVVSVCDAAASPWSWEMGSGEDPGFPHMAQSSLHVAGDEGALELPAGRLWRHAGAPDWRSPMEAVALPLERHDPVARQAAHFAAVVAGREAPLVTGRDGLRALELAARIAAPQSAEEAHAA